MRFPSRVFYSTIQYGLSVNSPKIIPTQFPSQLTRHRCWYPVRHLRRAMPSLSNSFQNKLLISSLMAPMIHWLNSMSWRRPNRITRWAPYCCVYFCSPLTSSNNILFRSARNLKIIMLARTTNLMMEKQTMSTTGRPDPPSKEYDYLPV